MDTTQFPFQVMPNPAASAPLNAPATPLQPLDLTGGQKGFATTLQSLQSRAGEVKEDPHEKAEKTAGDLVANALILPVLKQVRRSAFSQNSIFGGGIGEKTFGPQFDMQIADRIAHSPRMGVTTALAARLEKRMSPAPSETAKTSTLQTKLDLHG